MENKIIKESLSDRFVKMIVESIVSGEYVPNEDMPSEAELAEKFGVSRTVVREGMQEVSNLGLIEKKQGRLSNVAPRIKWNILAPNVLEALLKHDNKEKILRDLFTARLLIESYAASEAARKRKEEDINRIEARLMQLENSENMEQFQQLDISFHEEIHLTANNVIILSIMSLLRDLLITGRRYSKSSLPISEQTLQHRAIFDAIKESDPEAAREAMCNHIRWASDSSGYPCD